MILQGSTTSGSHWDFLTPETSASRGSQIGPWPPWASGFSKQLLLDPNGCFLKWWVSPTGPWVFPTKNDHFGVEIGGYHYLRKHPNILIMGFEIFREYE